MRTLLKNASQIVTVDTGGKHLKRGKDSPLLNILENHSIVIENDLIADIIPNSKSGKIKTDKIIDAGDGMVLPGLVECHTHAAFAGSRSAEFLQRLKGASYEEIAKKGGGINSTVKAVRTSSFEELVELIKPRIDNFISQGITSLEIKSGYGLSYYDEIKLLQVINYFKTHSPIEIIPTFLGAHTYPSEYKNDHNGYIRLIINELLPYLIKNNLALYIDAFCEKTAFSADEVDKIFSEAVKLGYKLRLHTDQFNSIGGIDIALKNHALSVDHLEVVKDDEIEKIANSDMVSVLLPGVSFFLDYQYAPARKLLDSNAIVALSTDFNPGSSNIQNIHFIMSLAAMQMKMTGEEIISAVTINAAKALDMSSKIGSIEIGKQADFSIFNTHDYSEIIYNIGNNMNRMTVKKGKIIYQKNPGNE